MSEKLIKKFTELVDESVELLEVEAGTERAFGEGVNYRFNLKKGLQAAAQLVTGTSAAAKVILLGPGPETPAGIYALYSVWGTALDAVRQQLTDLEYVMCIAVSNHSDGLAVDSLESTVRAFIDSTDPEEASYWISLTEKRMSNARNDLANLDKTVDTLKKKGLLKEENGTYVIQEKHFSLGFEED